MQRDTPAILMIGAAVDEQTMDLLMRVDRIPQVQSYRFQWALVHGIEDAIGRVVDVLATVPTRDFPRTRKIWFAGRRGQRTGDRSQKSEATGQRSEVGSQKTQIDQQSEVGSQKSRARDQESGVRDQIEESPWRQSESELRPGTWVQMPMVNLLGLKQISRLLTCSWFTFRWLWCHRRDKEKVVVLTDGLVVPHLLPTIVLCPLFRAKAVAVLTDPPVTYTDESLVYHVARWFDRALLSVALRRLSGVIALTAPLAGLLAPEIPALVMEGIVSDEVEGYVCQRSEVRDQRSEDGSRRAEDRDPRSEVSGEAADQPFVIMYAGQLHEDYGAGVILDAFAQLDGDRWQLWLYGSGTLETRIQQVSERDPRIRFFGFQPAAVIFSRMQRAAVMVSPRPVDDRIAPFSFPSKLIEYLAMGKIVIATRLPSIPTEYYPHLIFFESMSASDLAAKIRVVAELSPPARRDREEAAKEFVRKEKTQVHQGYRVVEFLQSLL